MCIVQDDAKDWERESSKMAAIFRGAFLTISATDAANCRAGLGIRTSHLPAVHFNVKDIDDDIDRIIPNTMCALRPSQDVRSPFLSSLIHTRAWIFQENILSRRFLHVTHGQMI
jgi:hypothetical protein